MHIRNDEVILERDPRQLIAKLQEENRDLIN